MSERDRIRWNERHRERAAEDRVGGLEPAPFLAEALAELSRRGLPRGRRALDVAAGRGRHSLALARAGFDVLALDVSDAAMAELAERARAEGLPVTARAWDLDDGLPRGAWDLVVVVHFLERALFPALRDAVAPGGALVVETFTTERGGMNPAYCLAPGELAAQQGDLATILSRERDGLAQWIATR